MLAIYGALVLIDRITAFMFTELVILIAPIVIILYSTMQTFVDGIYLSIGVIIMSFLLGNFDTTYLIFVPVGIITGLAYSFGITKNLDKRTLLLMSIVVFTAGEIIACYFINPLLGISVSQNIREYKLIFDNAASAMGTSYTDIFKSIGLDFDKIIVIIFCLSTILVGVMEGIIIHILSVFLLKRFKIKDLGSINLWDNKPNKVVAYLALIAVSFLYINKKLVIDETLSYILITISIIGYIVLFYYGYIFLILYGNIVLRKNIAAFVIIIAIFMPYLAFLIIILGFLYAAGPLRLYLERKLELYKQVNNKQDHE